MTDIENAVKVLREGGVILYPTDTIWGIGCDATCDAAVRRIYDIKRRNDSKALLLLTDSLSSLSRIIPSVPEAAKALIEEAYTPLSIIYSDPRGISPELIAEDNTVGIRICSHEWCREVCRQLGHPIVSTSANISGEPSPSCFAEIGDEVKSKVDYIAKTGRDAMSDGQSSRIVKITPSGEITVIR